MFSLKSVLCVGALYFTASVAQAEPFKWDVVSRLMQDMSKNVVQNDDVVSAVSPIWDAKYSDLAKEKLRYTVQAELKKTPWINEKAKINSTLTLEGVRGTNPGIKIHSATEIGTDTLALVRYTARIALREVDERYDSETYKKRVQESLRAIIKAGDISELHSLLKENLKLAREIVDEEAKTAEESAGVAKSEPTFEKSRVLYLVNKAAAYKEMKLAYDGLEIEPTYVLHKVTKFKLKNKAPKGFLASSGSSLYPRFVTQQVDATLQEGSIVADIYAISHQRDNEMDRLKDGLQEALQGLQDKDAKQEHRVQDAFKQALREFRRVIDGNLWH